MRNPIRLFPGLPSSIGTLSLGLWLSCLTGWCLPAAQAAEPTNATICLMSYNLRYASTSSPNAWPDRRPLMVELIRQVKPDLIGTQEGLYAQLQDLAADLPDYAWVGTGRDGGNRGEFMAIFYRKARFQALQTNHFWLSDTPEIPGSSTWGNSNRRMVTWLRLQDQNTRQEFYLFNTHFDHQVQLAREKSAHLVRERVTALNTPLPVLLTGDFNAGASNPAHELLVGDGFFKDSWFQAKERRGEGLGTFNGFKGVPRDNTRIDWILTRGEVQVDATEIVTFSKEGHFPSDHCPLAAWLRLGP